MGLTKQYLRYIPSNVFNVIGSGRGGGVWLGANLLAVAAVGNVDIWDTRRKEKLRSLTVSGGVNKKLEVTCLSRAGTLLAVGYSDGSIRLFDYNTGDEEVTFTGHKSAVTCLSPDKGGLRLVSGSRDTTVVVWDLVAESGLCRLVGHKSQVTSVKFLESRNSVVSASKDTLVKFWDLSTQHCYKTLTGHLTEVWGLVLINEETQMVTGGVDSELRVWSLKWKGEDEDEKRQEKKGKIEETTEEEEEGDDDGSDLIIRRVGSILRKGEGRVLNLVTDSTARVVACHGSDNLVETFVVCTKEEIQKRLIKKAKKEKKRTGEEVECSEPSLQEMVKRTPAVKVGGKVKNVDLVVDKVSVRGVVVLANNQVEMFGGELGSDQYESQGKLDMMGHRTDVRSVAFSSDNTAVATGSSESVKVWNRNSQACVRTMSSSYVLGMLFCPGDRHVVTATKTGKLEIFNLASGEMTESVAGHTGEVWGIVSTPDNRGFVTGGADKSVKFWDYELVTNDESGTKVLSVVHKRTLSLDEGVTAVSVSSDGRLVAVALLDSTVKVFFVDSLKFFLSLYGHKLPVVSMDISTDSSLIVTGSADRNLKIWGLDFGDCHKSIFSHDDTVTGVRWLPNTHMVVSTGKDGEVKIWDGDTFVRIQTLSGHVGEVWSLAISPNAKWVVSCGKDRSVRLWEKTSEVLVLDDERETEREEAAETEVGERVAVPGESTEVMASKRTAATERGAESLMEALELYKQVTREQEEEGGTVQLPPLMMAYGAESPLDFVCGVVGRLKPADLEETLLVLPLDIVKELINVLAELLASGKEVEVMSRCLLFLLEIHHGPIVASEGMEQVLRKVNVDIDKEVSLLRDKVGTNLAGLRFLSDKLEEKNGVEMFTDATTRVRERNKKKKKKEKSLQRAVMAI